MRQHIHIVDSLFNDLPISKQTSHSNQTHEVHYGISKEMVPKIGQVSQDKYFQTSLLWMDFVGIEKSKKIQNTLENKLDCLVWTFVFSSFGTFISFIVLFLY